MSTSAIIIRDEVDSHRLLITHRDWLLLYGPQFKEGPQFGGALLRITVRIIVAQQLAVSFDTHKQTLCGTIENATWAYHIRAVRDAAGDGIVLIDTKCAHVRAAR